MIQLRVDSLRAGVQARASLWRRRFRYNWELYKEDRLAVLGLLILLLFVLLALVQPVLLMASWDREIYDPINGYSFDDSRPPPAPPSAHHLLGTDVQGRDILSQLLYSIRIELMLAFLAALVTVVLGTAMGVVAAYFTGRTIDLAMMRAADLFLVLPPVAFMLFLGTLVQLNIPLLGLLIGALTGGKVAIIMKSRALEVTVKPYVQAARVVGGGSFYTIRKHVLPNVVPHTFLFMMFSSVIAILAEALLSYYGGDFFLGRYRAGPTGFIQMSWGLMLYLPYHMGYFMGDNVLRYWWLCFPASVSVTLLASAFYLVGRGFNQIANPRLGTR